MSILTPREIILEQVGKELKAIESLLEEKATSIAKQQKCKRCGRSDKLRIVPLHEDPFPLPSKIVLYCGACKYNKAIMTRDEGMLKYYTDMLNKKAEAFLKKQQEIDNDKVIKDPALVDKLIKK